MPTELSPWASTDYVTPYDERDAALAPVVVHGQPRERIIMRDAPRAPQWDAAPIDVTPVWQPGAGTVSEIGRPTDRAWATILRAAPVWLFAGPLCVAAVYLLDIRPWGWTVPIWAGVSLVAHLLIVWVDLAWNSPGSVERHRVNAAARLKRTELQHAQELRRAIVEAYLDHLEGGR